MMRNEKSALWKLDLKFTTDEMYNGKIVEKGKFSFFYEHIRTFSASEKFVKIVTITTEKASFT